MPLFRNDNSYRRRNSLIPPGVFLGSGVILFFALLLVVLQFVVPGFVARSASPFWMLGNGLTGATLGATSLFGNSSELTRERNQYADENLALHEENRTLAAQIDDLKRLIGTTPETSRRILAGVLARPPVSPYDTIIVDAGSTKGVHVGAIAFGPGGVPLGTMANVTDVSARIELFSTGGRTTEGWVGDTRVPITLTGKGAGVFEATLPRDSGVALNAVVYVPGPGALPIGTVVRIDSNPSSPRDIIHIAPYANLFSLTWVEIAP